MFNNVNIKNGFFGYDVFDDNGKVKYFNELGRAVILDDVCQSIEDGVIVWRVSFDYLGSTKHFEFERSNIAKKELVSVLQGQGADITAKSFNYFIDSMRLQECQVGRGTNTFKRTGWIQLPYRNTLEYHYRCGELISSVDADYVGSLVLTPQGDYESWKSMVESEVIGRVQLETILLASISAIIVGIHGMNATTDNPIYHINARSGTGKSTASWLAGSVYGEPFDGMRHSCDDHGVMKQYFSVYGSWGATAKATVSAHAGNRGTVAVINELGKFVGNDMTTVVFNLSEGSDIKRLNTRLDTLVTEGFNTVFISNGEMSLIGRCKSKLEGIKNRVMEITVPMTESAEHSRRIKDVCTHNNGHVAPKIAQYIIDNGSYQMIQSLYEETLTELSASAPEYISGRFIEKFPVFLVMASKIAEKALGITFNTQAVVDFCYECAKKFADDEGDVDSSYTDVISECSTNIRNFYQSGCADIPLKVWGAISYPNRVEGSKTVTIEYGVKKNTLKEILEKHGHPNMNTCIDIWKKAGVLNYEAGKNTRKRKVGPNDGDKEHLYILKVLEDKKDEPSKKKSQLVRLLKDDEEESKDE